MLAAELHDGARLGFPAEARIDLLNERDRGAMKPYAFEDRMHPITRVDLPAFLHIVPSDRTEDRSH